MNQVNAYKILLIILMLAAIILFGKVVYELTTNEDRCVDSPFIYGAKKLGDANQGVFSCSCVIMQDEFNPRFQSPIITFSSDSDKIEVENKNSKSNPLINFSAGIK